MSVSIVAVYTNSPVFTVSSASLALGALNPPLHDICLCTLKWFMAKMLTNFAEVNTAVFVILNVCLPSRPLLMFGHFVYTEGEHGMKPWLTYIFGVVNLITEWRSCDLGSSFLQLICLYYGS